MEAAEYSLEIVVITGAALLAVGLFAGYSWGRRASTSAQKYREVERKLDQVLQDKKLYEDEVVDHFTNTAQLLNQLTESYRDVHNHLAQGAATLCQGAGPVSLEQLNGNRDPAEIPADMAAIQPPLDYAPKTSPDEKGMLNEEFGLERNKASSTAAPQVEEKTES